MPILCHLSQLIQRSAEKYGDRMAMQFRDYSNGTWRPISWNIFAKRVTQVSRSLIALGMQPQEHLAIFSQNKPEFLYVEFGAFGSRNIVVPFYATSSGAQVQFMVNDAKIRIVFVGEQQQYDALWSVVNLCHPLEHIVIFDPAVKRNPNDHLSMSFVDFLKKGEQMPETEQLLGQRLADASLDDTANMLYTSGTTGQPKGVIIRHSQYRFALEANSKVLPISEKDLVINFLPYTHVFEGAWTKLCLCCGAQLAINLRPQDIQQSLREVNPTCMCSVPRFWEKVYQGVMQKMETSSALQRNLITDALRVGAEVWEKYTSKGLTPPLGLRLKYAAYDKTLLRLLRKTLGLPHPNIFPTAGATVSPEVERFIHATGFNMIAGYGLTETCATVSFDYPNKPVSTGSIGRPMPGVDVKISEEGEILVKAPSVTPGYFKREEETRELFTEDGWLRTGDAGYLKDGELYITERIKDLFKTSNGKYIAPQMIEGKLLIDRHFEQVVIIADQRKFVAALIVPSLPALELYAQQHDIAYASPQELCRNTKIIGYLSQHIDTLQQELASYEKIKRFVLLEKPFTMENGELTNTLKIRRRVIYQHYAEQIEQMYAQAEAEHQA